MDERNADLIVVLGPTASGKSALGIALAQRFSGEIVSADSRQLYRGMDIGTAKVTQEEQAQIPHHLLDCVDPDQVFTAGDYAREAAQALATIRGRAKLAILVGGTGLYLRALLMGLFEGPGRSETLRERLSRMAERHGREFLHRFDPLEIRLLAVDADVHDQARRARLLWFRRAGTGTDAGAAGNPGKSRRARAACQPWPGALASTRCSFRHGTHAPLSAVIRLKARPLQTRTGTLTPAASSREPPLPLHDPVARSSAQ